jgi:hypothetical protein
MRVLYELCAGLDAHKQTMTRVDRGRHRLDVLPSPASNRP